MGAQLHSQRHCDSSQSTSNKYMQIIEIKGFTLEMHAVYIQVTNHINFNDRKAPTTTRDISKEHGKWRLVQIQIEPVDSQFAFYMVFICYN